MPQRAFDDWIRSGFADLNTEIERRRTLVRESPQDLDAGRQVQALCERLREQGRQHIVAILGGSPLEGGFEDRLLLLGNVGMFMAACTRHGLNEPLDGRSPLEEESRLALRLGSAIGVAPRFILATYATHNKARDGIFKTFTRFQEELLFIEYNTVGIFEYERAADALTKISHLGISNPISRDFFHQAQQALDRVSEINDALFDSLDVDIFFHAIRPYYLPAYVGDREYRGVNAGDFVGINQIDLLLGLCSADDPFYRRIILEKMDYVLPSEQEGLRRCLLLNSLLDEFLSASSQARDRSWFQENAQAFLLVCRSHGRGAANHHNKLVQRFIVGPAKKLPQEAQVRLTASGPPLPDLLRTLERLRDLRLAKDRPNIGSRFPDLEFLRSTLHSAVSASQ